MKVKIAAWCAACAGVMALGQPALAADVAAPATYDWTGFYLGANAGAAWTDLSAESAYDIPASPNLGPRLSGRVDDNQASFTGGGMVGYNYQVESLVIGAEADFNYLGAEVSGSVLRDPGKGYASNASAEAPWFGTIRARAGFAADNLLFYATGGLAYGRLEGSIKLSDTLGTTYVSRSEENVNWGWTVGGGIEYAATSNIIVGAEYLYVDLGSVSRSGVENFEDRDRLKAEASANIARATLKYKF